MRQAGAAAVRFLSAISLILLSSIAASVRAQEWPGEPKVNQGTPQLASPRGDLSVKLMRLKDQCLPVPDLAEIEKDSTLSESTLMEACAIVDRAPNPCEASAEVYLYLMGQQGEWSPSKMFSTVWDVRGYDGTDIAENLSSLFKKAGAKAVGVYATLVDAAQWGEVILKESAVAKMRERFKEALEIYRLSRKWDTATYSAQVTQLNSEIAAIERKRQEIPVDLMIAVDRVPRPTRSRFDAPEVWQNYDGQVESLILKARDEEAKLLSRLITQHLLKRTLQDFREPLLGKSCDQRIKELGPDCPKKPQAFPAPKRPAPKHFSQLTDGEKRSLFDCLCKCGGGRAGGVGAAYDLRPSGPPGSSCADLRNGPCAYGGLGCWRDYMSAEGECAKKCMDAANVDFASTKEFVDSQRLKALDDQFNEAILNGTSPFLSSPEPLYPRLKKYVDEDMPGKAASMADHVASKDPGRKAKADALKRDIAKNLPPLALDLVREVDFDRAAKLLNKAVQMGDPTGEAKKNLGLVARWQRDWEGIQAGARRVDALLADYRSCEANEYYVKQVQPLVGDFNLVSPRKDQLVKDLNDRMSKAQRDCITYNNVPQIQQRILDAQKAGNDSLVADECQRALALKTLCDCQRVQYEKLLGQARANLKAQQDALAAKAQRLVDQGKAQESRGDLAGAIQSYDGARQIRPSPEIDKHIRDLQAALDRKKQEEDRRTQAARWVQEGQVRERASNYPAAIDCYQKALSILPSPEVEGRIKYLRGQMQQQARQAEQQAAQQQRLTRAKVLTDQGLGCEKRGDLAGAVANYQQANQVLPNAQVEQHIRQLQEEIARRERTSGQGQGARPSPAPVQPPPQQPSQGSGSFRASGQWPVVKDGEPATVTGALAVAGTRVEGTLKTRGEDPGGGGITGILEMTLSGTYAPGSGHMHGTLGRDVKATYFLDGKPTLMHFAQEGTWEADVRPDGSVTGTFRGRWDDPEAPVRYEFPIRMRVER